LQGLRSAFALDMVPEPGNGREAAEGYAGSPFDSSINGLPVRNYQGKRDTWTSKGSRKARSEVSIDKRRCVK